MTLTARDIIMLKIQERLETFLPDSCVIGRRADDYDSTGAPTGDIESETTVACRVITGKSDIEDIGQQPTMTEWYRLIVPLGTELAAGYIVTLADDTVYQVISIVTQRTDAPDMQALIKREMHG